MAVLNGALRTLRTSMTAVWCSAGADGFGHVDHATSSDFAVEDHPTVGLRRLRPHRHRPRRRTRPATRRRRLAVIQPEEIVEAKTGPVLGMEPALRRADRRGRRTHRRSPGCRPRHLQQHALGRGHRSRRPPDAGRGDPVDRRHRHGPRLSQSSGRFRLGRDPQRAARGGRPRLRRRLPGRSDAGDGAAEAGRRRRTRSGRAQPDHPLRGSQVPAPPAGEGSQHATRDRGGHPRRPPRS